MTFDEPSIKKLMNEHSKWIGSDHQSWDGDYPSALREILRLRGWLKYIEDNPIGLGSIYGPKKALAGDPAPGTEAPNG